MFLVYGTLINYIEHFHKDINVSFFKLRPTTKAMQFGGDRTMKAQWIVHMPVRAQGRLGRAEAFVVWRLILKAMKIQLNFLEDSMRVDGSQQASTTATETYTLEHYLELTGRPPPNLEEEQENETSHPRTTMMTPTPATETHPNRQTGQKLQSPYAI